ncbi:sporulation protein [Actinopolyspora erythraea]|uniref:Sporulation protein n=1 Tax=Actinopolyspora erythraea TaxID=414996 RepID=A0A099DAU8_9ACTN|nr:sporulation protein [Actinopolyspora erythraea]ASU80688.1 sporulation protein [Actinopolyspora erythraea]KGI82991.1 sporulation protein [Actinopolyspora erythraea]
MFKKMLQAVGIGGPSVDAVLSNDTAQPGGAVFGEVRVGGASAETEIQQIVLTLVAEVETDDDEKRAMPLQQVTIAEELHLAGEEYHTIPFSVPVPWETPITTVFGETLRGMRLGISTQVAVAKAVDTSDMDPVHIEPLDSQLPVIKALLDLGARVKHAELEHGHIHGTPQQLPCYQEIEFFPPAQLAGRVEEIELTFVAHPDSVDIVLQADKRGGLLTPEGEAIGRIHRSHEEAVHTDWHAELTHWLEAVATNHESGIHGYGGAHGHGGIHTHHVHEHPERGEERSGPGMGGMIAAGAGGLAVGAVGGMAVGEMLDGDEEEGEVDEEELAEELAEEMEEEE